MKKRLSKSLEKIGCRLISTRFGIYGDWLVITQDGGTLHFTTLGSVARWLDQFVAVPNNN